MAQNNKVLTVSYGAFSCTLEGFDDSVETLKAVTEYFRALSAADPRFGEEPMIPDTANLTRIAQATEPRSVDLQASDSGDILLRAEDAEFVPDIIETPQDVIDEPEETAVEEVEQDAEDDPQIAEDLTTSLADIMAQQDKHAAASEKGAEDPSSEPVLEPDSIAAKLQRIRAVVSRNESDAGNDTAESDEDVEEIYAGAFSGDISEALAEEDKLPETSKEEPLTAGDQAETATDPEVGPSTGGSVEDDADHLVANADAATHASEGATEQDGQSHGEDELMQRVLSQADTAADGDDTEAEAADLPEAVTEPTAPEDFSVPYLLKPEEMISDGKADVDVDLPTDRPKLVKVKRADYETARAANDQQAEADGARTVGLEKGDDDLARLMAAADEKLDEPVSSTSRETYSQLRAAVAAAQAERSVTGQVGETVTDDAYRDDLASAVRPERPTAKRPGRPASTTKPMPLKLVPEQRVDIENSAAVSGPVQPRRVRSAMTGANRRNK